jgi:hypothetical protein
VIDDWEKAKDKYLFLQILLYFFVRELHKKDDLICEIKTIFPPLAPCPPAFTNTGYFLFGSLLFISAG